MLFSGDLKGAGGLISLRSGQLAGPVHASAGTARARFSVTQAASCSHKQTISISLNGDAESTAPCSMMYDGA